MAELFLAKDTRNDRMVVLKRILPYLAEEAEFVRMFLDEARIAAAVHHPSIVELYELGHLEGSTFIAMEWVDGIDLRRVLQREQEKGGFMPVGVAAWIAARLCEGLFHAHSAKDQNNKPLGIIHRDVSPQNVMLSFKGDVKLVDFGIAKATAWMDRSKPGVIKGKFLYLAPEQLTTEPLDHRTDLFALGTLMYELTTGTSPFYRTSTEAVIYSIRMEDPDPPSKVRPNFPSELSRIILKCLTKDRERRYQTADEVRAALEDFIRLDAPTTRADVTKYVSKLFGDDNERTSIFIPPNAQSPNVTPRVNSRTDTSTARDNPFDGLESERTTPLSASSLEVVKERIPEGRRETGEVASIEDVPTGTTRNERPRTKPSDSKPSESNPWAEPDQTAPLGPGINLPKVPAKRDFVATAEIDRDPDAPLGDDVPPTALSESGARDLEVGEVFKPLVPTMQGLDEVPPVKRPSRPAPPVPDLRPADSIPEISSISVVSAGEATQGFVDPRGDDEPSQPSEPSEPSEPSPVPSTRAPPRSGIRPMAAPRPPPQNRRPPKPGDPDDDVETVDQANEFSITRQSNDRKIAMIVIGVTVVLVLVMLAAILWPASEPEKQKPVGPSTPTPTKTDPKPPPTPGTPGPSGQKLVEVQIRAVKGTLLSLDGKPISPEESLMREPGELVLKFTCPPKKKVRSPPGILRAKIPDSDQLVVVEVSCK